MGSMMIADCLSRRDAENVFASKLPWQSILKWLIRCVSLLITYRLYMYTVSGSDFPHHERFTLNNLFWITLKIFTIYGLGLWISVSRFAKNNRIIVLIMMLPGFIFAPLILGFPFSLLGWVAFVTFLLSIYLISNFKGST